MGNEGSTYRSGVQAVSTSFFGLALALLRSIVIARLIGPSEFGEFVVAAAVVGVADIATSPGFFDAVVGRAESTREELQSVWTIVAFRGVLTSVALLLFTTQIVSLMKTPQSDGVLQIMALTPGIRALASMAPVLAQRAVNYFPSMQTLLVGQVTDAIVSIVGLILVRTSVMLAIGAVIGSALSSLWSYRFGDFRPRLSLRFVHIRPLLSFARWRWLSQVTIYLSTRADDIVVGRFAGTSALGLYRTAFRVANIATTSSTFALGQVAFPALARSLRSGREEGLLLYQRYLILVAGLAGLLAVATGFASEGIIVSLLGPEWAGASTPLSIMCAAGFVRALLGSGGSLFLAYGRPALDTGMQIVRTLALFAGLAALVRYGVIGASFASLFSVILPLPVWLWGLRKVGLDMGAPIKIVLNRVPPLLGFALTWYGLRHLVASPQQELLIASSLSLLVWVSLVWALDKALWSELIVLLERTSIARPFLRDRQS